MHYDDRLATVLRLRTVGAAVARVQYRQLIDLLGTLPSDARSEQVDAAYLRLHELSEMIPAAERAAMLEERGLRLRAPRLVAALARMIFASLISLPSSASSRAISSRGTSVNRRRNRPTSRSSVLRQNCQ